MGRLRLRPVTAMLGLLLAAALTACTRYDHYVVSSDLMKYESIYFGSRDSAFEQGSVLFRFGEEEQRRGNGGLVTMEHLYLDREGLRNRGRVYVSYIAFEVFDGEKKADARVIPDSVRLRHERPDGTVIPPLEVDPGMRDCDANGCRRMRYEVFYPDELPDTLTEHVYFEIRTGRGVIPVEYNLPIERRTGYTMITV